MASVFSKIITGEIPSHKVAENANCIAILDINPLAMGHVLVIPKKEIDYLFDVDDALYQDLLLFAKRVALAIKQAVPCKRIGLAVIGLEVAHAHIHLVPINVVGDINFSGPKLNPTKEQLAEMAGKISRAIPS